MYIWNRCDECGRFIAYKDFDSGEAFRECITPSSHLSAEDYATYCKKHNPRYEKK